MDNAAYEERRQREAKRWLAREKRETAADATADIALTAIKAFFQGDAILSVEPGRNEGCYMVRFMMPTVKPQDPQP